MQNRLRRIIFAGTKMFFGTSPPVLHWKGGDVHFMEDRVKIYTMNTEELDNLEVYRSYYEEMSMERQSKIDTFRFHKDKKLSLGAGVLLDKGLREYGLRESQVRIEAGLGGKPYLPDYPEIHFNLSHSGSMVLAVFSHLEVGCDIEYMDKINLRVAGRFFCQSEYDYIMKQTGEEMQRQTFYRFWTLKESFMKVTGLGAKLPLDEFCFRLEEPVTVEQHVDHFVYSFREYQMGEYRAAVCCRER